MDQPWVTAGTTAAAASLEQAIAVGRERLAGLKGDIRAWQARAGDAAKRLAEMTGLFWHCLACPGDLTRDQLGEGIAALGLAEASKPLRVLLGQILQGQAEPAEQ